jgi:protein-disulfide isomerase
LYACVSRDLLHNPLRVCEIGEAMVLLVLRAVFASATLIGLSAAGIAQTSPTPSTLSDEQRRFVEEVTRDYIRSNPELLPAIINALKNKEQALQQERVREAIKAANKEHKDGLASPTLGNADGDVTIVEFLDYRCPYCRQMDGTMKQLLSADRMVRIVHKQLPILGPASVLAARVALVANKLGKHAAFHDALMKTPSQPDENAVIEVARSIGLDLNQIKELIGAPEITAALQRDISLAQALALKSTPSFVIGNELLPGATDLATLAELVDEARLAPK